MNETLEILNFLNIAKGNNLQKDVSVQNGYSLVNRIFDVAHSEVAIGMDWHIHHWLGVD